jgi:GT2 family glycosyltransferase
VAVVCPFRGAEHDAQRKHESLAAQRYASLEVVFAAESADDTGAVAVRAACAKSPARARFVVSGSDPRVLSGKARNMIAGWHATDAEFVAFCDADLALSPDDVASCLALFDAPRVGAVFVPCLFDARGAAGRLVMLTATVDASVLIRATAAGDGLPFLQGGLMMIRREALEAAGGIEVVADAISDDLRLARVLRQAGYVLRATGGTLVHRTPPESARAWLERYHRWMVCQRTEAPAGFWLMLCMHPLVVPLVGAALAPAHSRTLGAIAGLGLLVELAYTAWVDRRILQPLGLGLGARVFWRPLANLVHFVVCVAALVYPVVHWRGRRYVLGVSGRIRRASEAHPASAESTSVASTSAAAE